MTDVFLRELLKFAGPETTDPRGAHCIVKNPEGYVTEVIDPATMWTLRGRPGLAPFTDAPPAYLPRVKDLRKRLRGESVYAVWDRGADAVKIGYSSNSERRWHALDIAAAPWNLVMVWHAPRAYGLEGFLHLVFQKYALAGEWFVASEVLPTLEGLRLPRHLRADDHDDTPVPSVPVPSWQIDAHDVANAALINLDHALDRAARARAELVRHMADNLPVERTA